MNYSRFKVGDIVRCVKPDPFGGILYNQLYEVDRLAKEGWAIHLKELPEPWAWLHEHRFELERRS